MESFSRILRIMFGRRKVKYTVRCWKVALKICGREVEKVSRDAETNRLHQGGENRLTVAEQ